MHIPLLQRQRTKRCRRMCKQVRLLVHYLLLQLFDRVSKTVDWFLKTSFRVKCVIVQNRNNMVSALNSADIAFTKTATLAGSDVSWVKALAVSIKKGAPGGCPTSSLYADVMNSPQSQKLVVGSIVIK